MNFAERRLADRRADALAEWRALGRRAAQRRASDRVNVNAWLARYHAARAARQP